MRRVRRAFSALIDADHIAHALDELVAGKRRRPDVAWLLFRREAVERELVATLADGTWRPRGFDLLHVFDPKPRLIARAPVADRVVHSALSLVLEPTVLRSLDHGCFACVPGRGTHRALLQLLRLARVHGHVLHLDLRSYFPSIDLERLIELVAKVAPDRQFLRVVEQILESGRGLFDPVEHRRLARMELDWPPPGRGLPIGARTSQLFAVHMYLGACDHFIRRVLRVPGYVRYADDLFLFSDRSRELAVCREAIGEWLHERRGLRLKDPDAAVRSCHGIFDALGFRISRAGLVPRARRRRRARTWAREWVHRGRGGAPTAVLPALAGDTLFG